MHIGKDSWHQCWIPHDLDPVNPDDPCVGHAIVYFTNILLLFVAYLHVHFYQTLPFVCRHWSFTSTALMQFGLCLNSNCNVQAALVVIWKYRILIFLIESDWPLLCYFRALSSAYMIGGCGTCSSWCKFGALKLLIVSSSMCSSIHNFSLLSVFAD